MFGKLFQFIRENVKNSILAGFQDASDEMARKLENCAPLLIETTPETAAINGKPKARRTTTR